jgi:hypothetical protein
VHRRDDDVRTSIGVMKKAGLMRNDSGQTQMNLATGIAVGVALGAALGTAMDNVGVGIGIGIGIGIAISLATGSLRKRR